MAGPPPYGCTDPNFSAHIRECYLSAADFQAALGMDKHTFFKLPKWKRVEAKRKAKLF